MLPHSLIEPVTKAIQTLGDRGTIERVQHVGGGCINHAMRVETSKHTYFLKWNPRPLPNMFPTEAYGLQLIQATESVKVPTVYGVSDATASHPAYILMEWIDGESSQRDSQALLGTQLALMHQKGESPTYGLDCDNYIGSTPQYNGWDDDWLHFYAERRLRPQMELAQRNARMGAARRNKLEQLLARLDQWLGGIERKPALVHGDLWGGNMMVGSGGVPVLIDPAVYYGDRETEIAYTELFGGFNAAFYRAYQETYPLSPGYEDRRDLYNLYHVLNHLNLFGESYGYQVDHILRRYVG